jgi:integrase/recombinase XerD
MASIRKMRNKYYARIRWFVSSGKQEEILIPLKTSSLTSARTRCEKVGNEEANIKDGILQKFQFESKFRWLNPEGSSKYKSLTLGDIIPQYLAYRETKVRWKTHNRDRISLNQLMKYLGKSKVVSEIDYGDIEGRDGLIQKMRNEGYQDGGIAVSLRHIKTFFSWLYEKEKLIKERIRFDIPNTGKQPYRYFNEQELKAVYDYVDDKKNGIDSFFGRCFKFYELTGVRAMEVFVGELYGDWLIVDVEHSKGKNVRQIKLNEELKSILKEMHKFRDEYSSKYDKKIRYAHPQKGKSFIPPYPPNVRAYERISKTLKKVVRALDFKGKKLTIKSFRHTYGIKRVTMLGDIFQVAREMGHSNVTTTQLYLEFPEQRRLDDFPSLKKYIEKAENKAVLGNKGYESRDTRAYSGASS